MKAQQSPMIAKSILLMLTWKTNTQLNDETGNPCVCVFFLQFLIWNLTSLCHLKVVLLQCSAVVLKIKIICLSGGLLLRPCSQDWRLRGWLTKARRNAWHEDTSSFLPFLQIRSLWGALEDQQAEVHTVSVWCKTLDSSFFSYFSLYQSSSLMLSTVYWLIKKNKEHINLTCSSFLPAIPLRWACCLDAGQDWGWWERAHQTWEYLKTDICVGALFEHETSGGVRVHGGVGVQRQPGCISMKSSLIIKTELQLKGITGQTQRRKSWIGMVCFIYSTRSVPMTSFPPGHPAGRTLLDPDQPLRHEW